VQFENSSIKVGTQNLNFEIFAFLAAVITGFPLSFDIEIQGLLKDFQGPSNFIFKDQFSTEIL